MANLQIIKGTDQTIPVTITNSDGNAFDLTGATVFFTVKKASDLSDTDDTDAIITKDITSHTVPASGQTEIVLTDDDTDVAVGFYKWNLKVKDSTSKLSATLAGDCEIAPNVTKRIS